MNIDIIKFLIFLLSILLIKIDIKINIGIRTKIIYLSVKIGVLIKLYVIGRKYEFTKINIDFINTYK